MNLKWCQQVAGAPSYWLNGVNASPMFPGHGCIIHLDDGGAALHHFQVCPVAFCGPAAKNVSTSAQKIIFFTHWPLLKRRLFVRSMMTFFIIYFWSTEVYVCKNFLGAKRSCNVITASRRNCAAHIQQACESHGESAYTQSKPWSKQLVAYLLGEQFPLAWIVAIFGFGIQIYHACIIRRCSGSSSVQMLRGSI